MSLGSKTVWVDDATGGAELPGESGDGLEFAAAAVMSGTRSRQAITGVAAEPPRRDLGSDGSSSEFSEPDATRPVLVVGAARRARISVSAEFDDSRTSEELEPADPVVSAQATGGAPIAEPMPRATASAPRRPT